MLRAGDPYLLPFYDVLVACAARERFHLRGVRARGWLAHAECLETKLAASQSWEIFFLLRVRAMAQQRSHYVHLGVAGRGVSAGEVDLLQNGRRLGYAHARAAIFFWNQ